MKKLLLLLVFSLAIVGCGNKMTEKEVEKELSKLGETEYIKLKDANAFLNVVVIKLSDLEKGGVDISKIKNYKTDKACNKEKSFVEIIKDEATSKSKYKVKVTLSCK
ncbi:MAG: hypothetical protein RR359_03745 [Bacilli bacterium]